MAYSDTDRTPMSNRPDDSPNNTKKRVDISEDEGSAVLIKDQNKRLKMECDAKCTEARNKEIYTAIALEDLEKECINPRTKKFYVQPVYFIVNGEVKKTMDLQEYEEEEEKHSASSSPSSVTTDLDSIGAETGKTITSSPNTEMQRLINIVIQSGHANEGLIKEHKAACRQFDEAKAHAAKIKKEERRAEEEAKQNESYVEQMETKANNHDIPAMLALAKWYDHGHKGLKVDKHKAYFYYKKAADDHGDSMGQEMAGYMLIEGLGVTRDTHLGINLLELATQGDNASGRAAYLLGHYYSHHGDKVGIKRDYSLAKKWLSKVEDQDFPRPASREERKQAIRLLRKIEEREQKRKGLINPNSSPFL